MLIGCLILATPLAIAIAWRLPFTSSLMKWLSGRIRRKKKAPTLLLWPFEGSPSGSATRPTARGRGRLVVQHISRGEGSDLYVAGYRGASAAFYDLKSLCDWLINNGVPEGDPVWHYIDKLYQS